MDRAKRSLHNGRFVEWMLSWISMSIGLQLALLPHAMAATGLPQVLVRGCPLPASVQGGTLALVAIAATWGALRHYLGLKLTAFILGFTFYAFVTCGMVQTGRGFGTFVFGCMACLYSWRALSEAWGTGGQHGKRVYRAGDNNGRDGRISHTADLSRYAE